MISTMCPNIDHANKYIRNITARAFSVIASTLGIPSLLPFLKAMCCSKVMADTAYWHHIIQQNMSEWSGKPCHFV